MSSADIKKIAIIGTGISGLTAAYLLYDKYDITIFEKNDYAGGHTHTVDYTSNTDSYAIDTGFIVFNNRTYPNFVKLLKLLGIKKQKSRMSFSVSCKESNLEYRGGIKKIFSQRENLLRPRFYRLLFDIYRFNKAGKKFLRHPAEVTLRDFVAGKKYDSWLMENYLIPLTAAIWSAPPIKVSDIPAQFILEFFNNHGLLDFSDRPKWYVVKGGSREYVRQIMKLLADKVYLNTSVMKVQRNEAGVNIITAQGEQKFDAVVMACHSDQALNLLAQPTVTEVDVLGAIHYFSNRVVLHTDHSVLPASPRVWACWNYTKQSNKSASLTYYMNKLQSINAPENFCVSVNSMHIDPSKVIAEFDYSHPIYEHKAVIAKKQHHLINNRNRTYYVGAYWGNGFHEDGVVSSLQALVPLGVHL